MLNIFADALLIAARLGHFPDTTAPHHQTRRSPREFQDVEGLRLAESLRSPAR